MKNTMNSSKGSGSHKHKFEVSDTDELGREFGYCSVCLRDMQDLKNGKGVQIYNTHKFSRRANSIEAEYIDAAAAELERDRMSPYWAELRDLLNLPSTDCDRALVIQEIKRLKAEEATQDKEGAQQ